MATLHHRLRKIKADAAEIAQHNYEVVHLPLRERLRSRYGDDMRHLRVLDYGCGFTYPQVSFLHEEVKEVIGLEVAPVFRDGWLRLVRANGGFRNPKEVLWLLYRYGRGNLYFRQLSRRYGMRIDHRAYHIVHYDGQRIPFDDRSFDYVISNAVLQELPGSLECCAKELARVLKPGGAIDLEWHNFYSWSGNYRSEEENGRKPWGHLLESGNFSPLNRATPEDIVGAFAPWFSDLRILSHDRRHRVAGQDPDYEPEAEEQLTADLRERLAQYPREWLITRGFILQGYKPLHPPDDEGSWVQKQQDGRFSDASHY